MGKIPVCVAYEYDGKTIDFFPSGNVLNKAVPVYEYSILTAGKRIFQSAAHIPNFPRVPVIMLNTSKKM